MKTELSPHVRLTPDQVRALFDLGHLRPTGYLYLLLAALKQHGWKHRVENVNDFCLKWGISRSAFYRSKAKLISDGLMAEDIIGAVDLSTHEVHSLSVPESGTPVPESGTPVPESGTPVPESGTPVPESGTPVPESGTPVPEMQQPQLETVENTSFERFPNSYSTSSTECSSTLDSPLYSCETREENQGKRGEVAKAIEVIWEQKRPNTPDIHQPVVNQSGLSRQTLHSPPPNVPLAPPALNVLNVQSRAWHEWQTGPGPNDYVPEFVDYLAGKWQRDKADVKRFFQKNRSNPEAIAVYFEDFKSSKGDFDGIVMNVLRKKFEERHGRAANW